MLDTELSLVKFTAEDRCDACGAQAKAIAEREDARSELLFCGHHIDEHEDRLLEDGWMIRCDFEWDRVSVSEAVKV